MILPVLGFLEPYLGHYAAWYYADSLWWTAFGLLGNIMFSVRFIVQWYASEKSKKLVIPPLFWYLSFWGSIINLIYGFHIDKLPVILGYFFLPFINGRNLVLLWRGNQQKSQS